MIADVLITDVQMLRIFAVKNITTKETKGNKVEA